MIINCLSSKLALKKSDTTYSYPEEFSIPISRQLMIAKSAAGDQTIIIMVNYPFKRGLTLSLFKIVYKVLESIPL